MRRVQGHLLKDVNSSHFELEFAIKGLELIERDLNKSTFFCHLHQSLVVANKMHVSVKNSLFG